MNTNVALTLPLFQKLISRGKEYAQLSKPTLSGLVIFSSVTGYLTAASWPYSWFSIFWLSLGGFAITAASNTLNQILERELDPLMYRTRNRPLAAGRIPVQEAWIFAIVVGIGGLAILGITQNFQAFLLGLVALLLYAFVYTPLKRISSFGVVIGGIPGAVPPLLGYIAFTDHIGPQAWILFALQFAWQFPHFWAIAWILHEDYCRAGFKMLPYTGGKNSRNASTILIYTLILIPLSLLPYQYHLVGIPGFILISLSGIMMSICAFYLFREESDKAAKRLMFASFIYLPVVQLALVFDKF